MGRQQRRRGQARTVAAPMQPVALSLAIFLGLAVTLAGLGRLAQTDFDPAPTTLTLD